MGFHGRFGHLNTMDAAKASLLDIEENCDLEKIMKWFEQGQLPQDEYYDIGRLIRTIESLQMVIVRNGGELCFFKLPIFYKPNVIKPYVRKNK